MKKLFAILMAILMLTFACIPMAVAEDTPEEPPCAHEGATEVRGYIAATCAAEGYTGDTYCLNCGDKIATGTTIERSSIHTGGYVYENPVQATCTAEGYTGDKHCATCGAFLAAGTETPINPKHHGNYEIVVRNAKEPTCGAHGYTGDKFCSGCNAPLTQGSDLLPTGEHTDANGDNVCDECGASLPVATKSFKEYFLNLINPKSFFKALSDFFKTVFQMIGG